MQPNSILMLDSLKLLKIYLLEAKGIIHGDKNVPKVTPNGKHDNKNAFTIGIVVTEPYTINTFSAPRAAI